MARQRRRGGEAERITIIIVIIIAMLAVIATILVQVFSTPERNVKSKMDSIVSDYYENYFYKNVIKNGTTKENLNRIMDKFKEPGFSRVYFRQLLLYDNQKYSNDAPFITKYCDENSSYVIIYPDPPYSKTDYHTQFYYSCEF